MSHVNTDARRSTRRLRRAPLRQSLLSGREAMQSAATLEQILYGDRVPRTQNARTQYGRGLDLDIIDKAIRSAASGNMVALTDLGREAVLSLDGHTTGVLQKRLNRAGAIDWMVVANSGIGQQNFDHGLASERADFVRAQLMRIPFFRERLMDISWSTWDNRAALETQWEIGRGSVAGDSNLATGWRSVDLHWIHPRRLSFDQNRDVVVMDEGTEGRATDFRPKGYRLDDNPEKFIISTPRLFNDYREREGLLMRCMYWSFFQRLGTRERLALMEIFGAPWRLVSSPDAMPTTLNNKAIMESFKTIEQMSAKSAGWLAPGVVADFIQPDPGSGTVHKDVIEDARLVISKFVLGGTATTDVQATGLASNIGDVQLTEEDLIIAADLHQREGVIEHRLIDVIMELNYGPESLAYSPEFKFNIRGVNDREESGRVLKSALDTGVDVALEQAYELLQLRMPRDNEPRVSMVTVPGDMGVDITRARIVYPVGKTPPPGDLALQPEEPLNVPPPLPAPGAPLQPGQVRIPDPTDPSQTAVLELTPSDLASIVTVNEGRTSIGKGPLMTPDGQRDPDGNLTIAEFVVKRAAQGEVVGKGQGQTEAPPGTDAAQGQQPPAGAAPGAPPVPPPPPGKGPPKSPPVPPGAAAPAAAASFAVGDRVQVRAGKEHMPEHKGVAGTVKLVEGTNIGVLFDGTTEVHKWYAPEELEAASGKAPKAPAPPPPAPKGKPAAPAPAAAAKPAVPTVATSHQEPPFGSPSGMPAHDREFEHDAPKVAARDKLKPHARRVQAARAKPKRK